MFSSLEIRQTKYCKEPYPEPGENSKPLVSRQYIEQYYDCTQKSGSGPRGINKSDKKIIIKPTNYRLFQCLREYNTEFFFLN